MTKNTRLSPEVRQRAVRMVLESQSEYNSQWTALSSIAPKIGCTLDTLRDEHGVGPVCHELDIAPSTYYRHQQLCRYPEKRSQRAPRDDLLRPEIQRVYDENHSVYVAFILDVFAGVIVGWRVSSSMETTFVLDALEQALWARRPSGTIHHSDKGSQYVSLAYTQRLKDAELLASTGSTGDSYDNAMAESINGLYKAEVIHRKSWKSRAEVELAILTWVDWYNNRRLLERLGHILPAEAEQAYHASIRNAELAT